MFWIISSNLKLAQLEISDDELFAGPAMLLKSAIRNLVMITKTVYMRLSHIDPGYISLFWEMP